MNTDNQIAVEALTDAQKNALIARAAVLWPGLKPSGYCSRHRGSEPPDFDCGCCFPDWNALAGAHNELKQAAWSELHDMRMMLAAHMQQRSLMKSGKCGREICHPTRDYTCSQCYPDLRPILKEAIDWWQTPQPGAKRRKTPPHPKGE